jgi:hypothetical protein
MQKWEYTTIWWSSGLDEVRIDGELVAKGESALALPFIQQLGEQGWELVGIVSQAIAIHPNAPYLTPIQASPIRFYFKRPKE